MDLVALIPAFVVAVLLISASPGRRAALHGIRAAVSTVLGLEAGLYVWALCAGAGLAALVDRLARSEVGERARLEAVSGTVLIGLGLRLATATR
ncbi:hypothetical protein [Cryptosporangium sp. NPDC048952]|uniref:hypothetical protein n=1 Tax=Cryptosporangium sp. NPDC048952 TaxID=3363961 RepID=UPI00371E5A91